MKNLYLVLMALLFTIASTAQVVISTDFSDMDPMPANGVNNLSGVAVSIDDGTLFWHGSRYNDLSNVPNIGDVGEELVADGGDAVPLDPATDPSVRYIRTGSTATITDGAPTNHFFQITPSVPFVNGGKISLVVSTHAAGKGINVYNVTDAELLGTIDISGITKFKKETVELILPASLEGIKTIAFTRAEVDGSLGGVTFFTWSITIETEEEENGEVVLDPGVLIDTDFSDMEPMPANNINNLSGTPVFITNGTLFWHGSRFNDLSNLPNIGEVGEELVADGGDAVPLDPAEDSDIRFIRTGSAATITDGAPTNHYFQVSPSTPFVNGGKITLVVSSHATAKGINVYNVTDAELLGTIDISEITRYKKETVEFNLPESLNGVKTLAFTRAELDGSMGGTTFFTWSIKIETNVEDDNGDPTSIPPVFDTEKANIFTTTGNVNITDAIGKNIQIFSISGVRIYATTSASETVTIPLAGGIYIVIVNNVATKVLVK